IINHVNNTIYIVNENPIIQNNTIPTVIAITKKVYLIKRNGYSIPAPISVNIMTIRNSTKAIPNKSGKYFIKK
ncbi:MAG: hypothetical protein ACYDBX_03545, partial [Patescibacteria group bacterium]